VARTVVAKPSFGLLELSLAPVAVVALGMEPGNGDVDESLQEVALGGRRRAPLALELFVRLEVGALAEQE
jgi:hypothetical protein